MKKNFDDDKKSYLYDNFFLSNQNFATEHVKNSRFFVFNFSNCRFFCLNCQIQGFFRLPGKVTTLLDILNFSNINADTLA